MQKGLTFHGFTGIIMLMKAKTLVYMIFSLILLYAPAGCNSMSSANPYAKILVSISANKTAARVDQPVTFSFCVSNPGTEPMKIPIPDDTTISLHSVVTVKNKKDLPQDGHLALGTKPQRKDRWTVLAPNQSINYYFTYKWDAPGEKEVYLRYFSRFKEMQFPTIETLRIKIKVSN